MMPWVPKLLRLEKTAWRLEPLLGQWDLGQELARHLEQRLSQARRQEIRNRPPVVFLAVKNVDWEQAGLVDSWQGVAETVHYDWGASHDQHAPDWQSEGKAKFNQELVERIEQAVRERGITHFFSYLSGRWLYPETVDRIAALGVLTINFSFDDSHRFWGKKRGGVWTGVADIASHYDLNLTVQDPRDVLKYRLSGGRALYLPPGGNAEVFGQIPEQEKRYFVSFVGRRYGVRSEYIEFLQKNGIEVHARGAGWPDGPASHEEMLRIYAASRVVLGFGFVGGSSSRTSVKGRDFEIPLTGTAYCTSHDPVLASQFKEGESILFYRGKEDLLRLLRDLENRQQELEGIGRNGRLLALERHQWSARWSALLDRVGASLKVTSP